MARELDSELGIDVTIIGEPGEVANLGELYDKDPRRLTGKERSLVESLRNQRARSQGGQRSGAEGPRSRTPGGGKKRKRT